MATNTISANATSLSSFWATRQPLAERLANLEAAPITDEAACSDGADALFEFDLGIERLAVETPSDLAILADFCEFHIRKGHGAPDAAVMALIEGVRNATSTSDFQNPTLASAIGS